MTLNSLHKLCSVRGSTTVSRGHARITARYPTALLVGMTAYFTYSPRPSAVRGAAVMEPGKEASRAAVIARENTLRRTLNEAILLREFNVTRLVLDDSTQH